MNKLFTREEVIAMIDSMLQSPDVLLDAVQNENTDYDGEALFEMELEVLRVAPAPTTAKEKLTAAMVAYNKDFIEHPEKYAGWGKQYDSSIEQATAQVEHLLSFME